MLCVCVCVVVLDIWLKLDDDNVSEVSEEEVLKLSGGGMVCVLGMSLDTHTLSLSLSLSLSTAQVTGTWPTCCSMSLCLWKNFHPPMMNHAIRLLRSLLIFIITRVGLAKVLGARAVPWPMGII